MTSRQAGPKTYRRDFKNYHSYTLDGQKARGVTSIISAGTPKANLVQWAANCAADYAVDHLDALINLEDREAVRELCRTAHTRDRDAAARRGTEVHSLAERLQAGEEVEVPDELIGHVDSYVQFVEDWQPSTDTLVEKVIIDRKHRFMGTFDACGGLKGLPGRILYDIKTTRSGVFGEVALQLAAYAAAESYLDGTDEKPMPHVDSCAVLWVRSDGYSLIPITAGPAEFRAFLYVDQVAQFMDRVKRNDDLIGEPLTP